MEALPFEPASFGKVCTINTIYFWSSLDAGFEEMGRVLSPGSRMVVGFYPREAMERMKNPPDIFSLRESEEVIAALTRTGFRDVRLAQTNPMTAWKVVTGTR